MLNIDATDKIEGIASVADKVEFTCSVVDGTTVKSSEGLLSNSQTQIYLAVGATRILSLTLVNTHTSAVTVNIQKDPTDAGTLYRIIPKDLSLGIGYMLVFDGQRCNVLDASGNLLTSFANLISDTAYGAGWNGVTTIASSKNAVYDEMEKKVSATANITDNAVVAGDGGAKGVQGCTVLVSDNGEMTNPSQPCFRAYVNTTQSNVTGDNTVFNVTGAIWTEVFDQGGNLSNGTFTASVTGKYSLGFCFYVRGFAAGHTRVEIKVITSNRTFTVFGQNQNRDSSNDMYISGNIFSEMEINDTAYVQVVVYGGVKTIDVYTNLCHFFGALVC